MKRKIIKTAAVTGLCLALLAGGVSACAASSGSDEELMFGPMTGIDSGQPGEMPGGRTGGMPGGRPGEMAGGMQNGTAIRSSTDTAGEIVTGVTENSAMTLEADYENAVTYDVSENSTVKISASGTYIVTGTASDGSITVTKDTTGVVLILRDLDLTSTSSAALSVNKNAEVQIVIDGQVTLTDNEDPANEASDDYDGAAIKVKANAVAYLTGNGTLTVNGNAKNGIKAGDDSSLILGGGGTVTINAVNDGINGSYDVTILSGTVTVNAGDDGIHADHILTIGDDGAGPNLTVADSTEGLEGTVVNIAGGRISVSAIDDGINAANADAAYESELTYSVNITGGDVTVTTSADGIDSNGNVNLISGSAAIRSASVGGEAGIDYDGALYISDDFQLNNASGVAGPDGMGGAPGQMGGMPGGQMGGMPGNQANFGGETGSTPGNTGTVATPPSAASGGSGSSGGTAGKEGTQSGKAFRDVPETAWYYSYVTALSGAGIIDGMGDGTFDPDGTLTWAQAMKLLLCAHGDLSNVTGSAWAETAMGKAAELGLCDAAQDGAVKITRLDFCVAAAKLFSVSGTADAFPDCSDASVRALHGADVINGYPDGSFGPGRTLSRAEISKIIYKLTVI